MKRIATTQGVQNQLDPLFTGIEDSFRSDIVEEIDFDGRWRPDKDQVLRLPVTDEASQIAASLMPGALALDSVSPEQFEDEQIRAIFVRRELGAHSRLVLQAFSAQQRLSRKFAPIQHGQSFNRLESTAFSIDSQIHVLVEQGQIKFKSYNMAKRIFDLSQAFEEATDNDIQELCNMATVSADVEAIIAVANSSIRKLITIVRQSGVLGQLSPEDIQGKAAAVGLNLNLDNGRLALPSDRPSLKQALTFLDHGLYRSPVSDERYITNSRRKLI